MEITNSTETSVDFKYKNTQSRVFVCVCVCVCGTMYKPTSWVMFALALRYWKKEL